ncbi:MAG TPA: N-acetylmuramoyl-L-alanine amidase, partial [Thermoanaerobaculia bacterium]|nr:N-acetylmuramoyl-L-alanine amidase [Thermoanaerobaculia bacterium]
GERLSKAGLDGILSGVKDRRIWASLALLCLLPVLVAAQGERTQPQPPPSAAPGAATRAPQVVLGGREIAVPVTVTPSGPMFGLTSLAAALGGELTSDEAGESVTLRIADKDVVIGPGSAIVTVGDLIVSLSQPPAPGEGGLQVPVDFLRKTYGDLLGYAFEWQPETARLVISRRGDRELGVSLDVVHLQGMTTVVLQFPEEPRYQIQRQSGTIVVQMIADRLTPPQPRIIQDPLVRNVTIEPQQIRIQLAEGVQAASYVLENPFRLVFDVHPSATVEGPAQPTEAPRDLPGIRTIVLDPGHGGTEVGAIGPSGVQEKELTLQIARELAGKIGNALGVRVVLTRYDDIVIPHDTRAAIANQNKADLFVSIHLNSSLGAGAHGAETYFLSPQATDNSAARSAAAENLAGETSPPKGGPADPAAQDLELILWDLAQSRHMAESQRLANLIQRELNQALQLKDRGVKQAPFRVLMGTAMPAVLVELGFISNPDEEKKLQDPAYRDQLLDAVTRAIGQYKALVDGESAPPAPKAPAGQAQPSAPGGQASPAKPPARPGRPA